jgi:hypothetical protein
MGTRATWLATSLIVWTFIPTAGAGTPSVTGTQPPQTGAAEGLAPDGAGGGGSQAMTQNGAMWCFQSGTEGWTPQVVSIGNGGTEAFSEVAPFNSYTRVFSAFDNSPPTPVLQSLVQVATFNPLVDSADDNDTHVAMYDAYSDSTLQTHTVYVKKYSASSPSTNWSFAFPTQTNGHNNLGVKISRNGGTIVAAVYNIWTAKTDVVVFNSSSGIPISSFSVSTSGPITGVELSADGTRLELQSGATISIVAIPSGSVVFTQYIFDTIYQANAISGDGSIYAYGTDNAVKVYKRSPSTGVYSLALTHTVAGTYCNEVAISADGSTLAAAFNHIDHFLSVTIDAVDLSSGSTTMSHTVTGTGAYENVASAISISADGQRFAVGLWGDQPLSVPQIEVFAPNQGNPIAAFTVPGSVMALDLSADGNHVAVASKSVHATVSGSGGRIEMYQVGDSDCSLHGVPHAGANVSFEVHGHPGSAARLLYSSAAATPPVFYPGIGTLYIDRVSAHSLAMGTLDGTGVGQVGFGVPSLVGSTWYFQGFTTQPRHLTQNWVKMTIFP